MPRRLAAARPGCGIATPRLIPATVAKKFARGITISVATLLHSLAVSITGIRNENHLHKDGSKRVWDLNIRCDLDHFTWSFPREVTWATNTVLCSLPAPLNIHSATSWLARLNSPPHSPWISLSLSLCLSPLLDPILPPPRGSRSLDLSPPPVYHPYFSAALFPRFHVRRGSFCPRPLSLLLLSPR